MRFAYLSLSGLLMALLLAACGGGVAPHELGDLQRLPQDLAAYVSPGTADIPLLPDAARRAWHQDFRRRYLAPWQDDWRGRPPEKLFDAARSLLEQSIFGSNKRPVPLARRRQWLASCSLETFPGADYPAITLRVSNLRGLPTRQPAFLDFNLPGEGYPFDYLQYSAIPAGTPVRVRHRCAEGAWLLVETDAMFGWLPATDVARIDQTFARRYAALPWQVVVKDDAPLADAHGEVLAVAGLGSLWAQGEGGRVLAAVRGGDGLAVLRPATLPEGAALPFPVPLTPRYLADFGNRLLGAPYDWGGQLGLRDCSATVRDLFACFGIYLPRNSAAQAGVGRWLDLSDLPVSERARVVCERGRPWLTLASLPGHIMLYVGEHAGEPAFLHTLWGLKTRRRPGEEGRFLVGRTVITGLRPGEELADLARPDGWLAARLKGLALLEGPGRD